MRLILSLAALFGISAAAPQFGRQPFQQQRQPPYQQPQQGQLIPILSYTNDVNYDGSFQYSYETGNGINAQATGSVRPTGSRDAENSVATAVQGSYSYTAPDGQVITVNYVADENGYRATGAHLPVAPPIPAEIARSLEFIQAAQRNNPPLQKQYNNNQFG